MKYHDLKEKDAMTLYEDGVGTIVSVCFDHGLCCWFCELFASITSSCLSLRL